MVKMHLMIYTYLTSINTFGKLNSDKMIKNFL